MQRRGIYGHRNSYPHSGCKKGRLAEGYDADIVVFDDDINVSAVFTRGVQRI